MIMMHYHSLSSQRRKNHLKYFIILALSFISIIPLNSKGISFHELLENARKRVQLPEKTHTHPIKRPASPDTKTIPPKKAKIPSSSPKKVEIETDTTQLKIGYTIQTQQGIANLGNTCYFNASIAALSGGLGPEEFRKLLPAEQKQLDLKRQTLIDSLTWFSDLFSAEATQGLDDLGASLKTTAQQFQTNFDAFIDDGQYKLFKFNGGQQDAEEFIHFLFERILGVDNTSNHGKNIKVYLRTLTHHHLSKHHYSDSCDFTTTTEELYIPAILDINMAAPIETLLNKLQTATEEIEGLRVDIQAFTDAMQKKQQQDRPQDTDRIYDQLRKGPLTNVKNTRELKLAAHLDDLTHIIVMPRPYKYDQAQKRAVKLEKDKLAAINNGDTIDIELLDLDNQLRPKKLQFRRVAIVAHIGSTPYGGHYKAFVKDKKANDDWYQYDDQWVTGPKRRTQDFDTSSTLVHYVNIYERI